MQAVLFDLDGTLLDNDLDAFLAQYFKKISACAAAFLAPRDFARQLMAATEVMLQNDGHATNEAVFAEAFYPRIGRPREVMEPVFMDFYRDQFRELRVYTRCRPEARAAVQAAFDLGYQVAVATNPVFPAIAIEQRLDWAGVDGFPYARVTSYENSHGCKPSGHYYREIVQALGCEPAEALMVGNEGDDMAAAKIGCATCLLTDGTPGKELDHTPPPTYRVGLGEMPALLEKLRS